MRKYQVSELGRPEPEEFLQHSRIPVTLILDNVRSALNTGSAFRTADAFAVEQIALCGITAIPPHREIAKTALGATETVPWRYFASTEEAIAWFQEQHYRIWVVEQAEGSTPLQEFRPEPDAKYALVFGNEVNGVDDTWMDAANGAIEVPQWGSKHSLNVSVCIGVVLWEIVRQLKFSA